LLLHLGLLVLSAFLFAFSHPHFLSDWGWFPLAYIAFVPVVVVIHRVGFAASIGYGAFYGLLSYSLHNYWLLAFHPLAIFLVPGIYAVYFVLIFPLLKAADRLFPKYGFLLQLAIWLAYEYLRTLGFLGYSYGIIGYSQYVWPALVRLSSLTGVWGVSTLVAFPSFFLGSALSRGRAQFASRLRSTAPIGAVYLLLFTVALVYGATSVSDYSDARMWRVALIQQDVDPHRGGDAAYRESLTRLLRQSRAAMAEPDPPEAVIWSETSFVPGIDWHTRFRTDPFRYDLVRELTDFLATQDVPYVIGNADRRLERDESGRDLEISYNAVLLYEDGEIRETYRKRHLVPFTEHFPYERQFPWMHQALLEADTHFWGYGRDLTVFETDGIRFSTPICFEDTFGYLSRDFVRNGAEVIVNLTNDSWAMSVPAAMQHMAMAVFRATENRRSVVRSTNGGMTSIIDPNGVITDIYPAFQEGYLIGDAPIYTGETTLYTRYGDWYAVVMLVIAAAGLLTGLGLFLRRRSRRA
jgi:apolipoprotein N-acyltransferase